MSSKIFIFCKGIRSRRSNVKRTGINHTGFAHCHTVGAEEEKVTANLFVLNCIDCTVDINARINKVDQISSTIAVFALTKVHIGNIISIQLEFSKLVNCNVTDNLTGKYVSNTVIKIYSRTIIRSGNRARQCSYRLHYKANGRNSADNFLCSGIFRNSAQAEPFRATQELTVDLHLNSLLISACPICIKSNNLLKLILEHPLQNSN